MTQTRSLGTMKAVVVREPGGPEALKIETREIPQPKANEVLIRVKAFGLNRSEKWTRQGRSPNVQFPKILGIEATGVVEEAPNGEFEKGQIVMTAMGGMGLFFDGGYAEYTVVPSNQVQAITTPTKLGWEVLGALPEMLQVSYGCIHRSLEVKHGDRVLIRGGTTSIGLTSITLAKNLGAHVTATSRQAERDAMLREYGADEFLLEDGDLAAQVAAKESNQKFSKILEVVGAATLKDSLKCITQGGTLCVAGRVGNEWTVKDLNILFDIPWGSKLTVYGGMIPEFMSTPLNDLIQQVENGSLKVKIGKTFHIDQIVEAHRCMEDSAAEGKIVVLTE